MVTFKIQNEFKMYASHSKLPSRSPPQKVVQNFFFFLSDRECEHQMVPRDKKRTLHLNDFQNKQTQKKMKRNWSEKKLCS